MQSDRRWRAYAAGDALSRLDRTRAPAPPIALPVAPFDASVARFFAEIRRHLSSPRHVVAAHLGTTETVLTALEAGHIADLPRQDELERIVTAYTALIGLDARPILSHIAMVRASVAAGPASSAPPPVVSNAAPASTTNVIPLAADLAAAEARLQAATHDPDDDWIREMSASVARVEQEASATEIAAKRRLRRRRRIAKTFAMLAAPVVAAGLLMMAAPQASRVHKMIDAMPSMIVAPVRDGYNAILVTLAPRREGLRWIEIDDPKSRRADKLPNPGK